jgi:hypothetical protein
MKTSLYPLVAFSLLFGVATAIKADTLMVNPHLVSDPAIASMTAQVDTVSIKYYMEGLQAFQYHNAFRPNHDSTAQWMLTQFTDMGISDVRLDTFYHPHANEICYNVVATIPGSFDTTIVYIAGGHYDTPIGVNYQTGDTDYSTGADDNGSGTTALLEMARLLALPGNRPARTVRFVAFDAEESGVVGSRHYADEAYQQGMNIGLMSNYDCIGSWVCDSLYHSIPDTGSESFADLLCRTTELYGHDGTTSIRAILGGTNAGDNWRFYKLGYPTTYSQEYILGSIHSVHDSTNYIRYQSMANIIRGGLGLMATISNYPKTTQTTVTDVGSGTELQVAWPPEADSNITAHRIYWGRSSGVYSDSLSTGLAADTIAGLTEDSLYYVGVVAVDNQGRTSFFINERTGTPRSSPLAPSGLTANPVDSGILLNWQRNRELDLAGYIVYHKIDNGGYDSLTYTTDTFLLDQPLSGASRYYYKVKARDGDGNEGPLSDSAYGRPITLDQGILIVDETNDWTSGSWPRDAQEDSFYNYILEDYKSTQFEYGTALQRPILADFGPYSTVAWFTDDYVTMLASGAVNDLKNYLEAGGKLWFAGWKPTGDIRNSLSYPFDAGAGDILYDKFRITHAELSGTTDSFRTAVGEKGYPDISADTLKYPVTVFGKILRSIEALTPARSGDTIYVMDMKNDGSPYEGRACAVRDSGRTVFFGFPLYFMNKDQAKAAAQKVMLEFGEQPLGVLGNPGSRVTIRDTRLFQNAPNPFDQTTVINYQLPKAGRVSLKVYNVAGQLVRTLVDAVQNPGSYSVKWDGRDGNNLQVSNGVYVCRLQSGGFSQTGKMVVLR